MTLTYLFSAEVTLPTKIAFFSLCLVDLWENGRRYRIDFNGQLLGKWVWAFQRHQNQPPNLTPSPHLGGRKHEKTRKMGFPPSNDNTLRWSFSDQQLPAAKLFAHMSGRHQWKNFQNRCIITRFTPILVHPLDWRKCATFKRLYFLNGCIDLDVRYTVGKDMTWSTSWPNFIGKVYHLQGQNIGQTSENSVFGLYYACKAAVSRVYDARSRRPPASASHCDSCATC